MFDELKEISYSKEIKDCKSLIVTPYNIKYCKEIKRLKSLRKAEVHLEPRRASAMEIFGKILNDLLFLQ